jgi:isoquinoline 1-oxidoreductase subunit beta
MNRRKFLLTAAGGLTVTFSFGCALPVIPKRPRPDLSDATSWIRYASGRYLLTVPRVEMGQNVLTAMKQIACEELAIEPNALAVETHSTAAIRRARATVGSESIKDFALPLAQACATLREAIASGASTGLIEARAIPQEALRSFARITRYVGKAVAVEQAHEIVTGKPVYASDVRRSNMHFGRVLRANASPELRSTAVSMDELAAAKVPGFVAIVRDVLLNQGKSEGIGIVARTPGALERIEAALAIRWQTEVEFDQSTIHQAIDIDRRRINGGLSNKVHRETLDLTRPWDVDIRIDVPLAAHAPIEPRVAVAELSSEGRLEMWVGSQDVFYQRDVIAKRLGLGEQNVVVHGMRVGGAFGGKTICTVELEAAVLARASKLPIKVQWTRAQEFRHAFHRPPSSHRLRARVRNGSIEDWSHQFASSHILFTNAVLPPWLQRLTDFIGDDGVARGSTLPYWAPNKRVEFDLARLPVFTGPWRGLGAGPNVFAIESAIDECARIANVDAVAFRLRHSAEPRMSRALERVASAANWPHALQSSDPAIQRGRGVACGVYKAMSYAAVVADVTIDHGRRTIRVDKLWCAHDCGRIINPDQVRAQCEGNLVWGLGMVLIEELRVAQSQIAAATFLDSPIPRMSDVPPMEIVLVDEGEPPTGAGETAIVAAGAAIANAIRNATGVRPTKLPLRYEDLPPRT